MKGRRGIWVGLLGIVLVGAGLYFYPLFNWGEGAGPGLGAGSPESQGESPAGDASSSGEAPPSDAAAPPALAWTPIVLERDHPGLASIALSTADPDATATNYALAYMTRETRRLKTVLTTAVADARGYSEVDVPYFGTSSPWVQQAVISAKEETASGAFIYTMTFSWATSTGVGGDTRGIVEVSQVEDQWLITNITP